jgi:hypothetical protein
MKKMWGNTKTLDCISAEHNYLKAMVPIFFLIVILFFSAWIRFDGITEQGISPGDNFRYIREAKIWAAGSPPKFAGIFYRPVSYFLHGMAIKIFGYNDYSIKILHGFMDMINILLIFFIAAKLTKNPWVGVLSSLLYAFLPKVIYLARNEMVHVESTTFVLLSIFFFILFDSQRKNRFKLYLLLFLSGLNSGLAANTHADLAFLAPGYVLYLFIKSYNSQNKRESLKEFLLFTFIFTFSFFTPYFLGFLLFGLQKVLKVFLNEASIVKWYIDNIYDPVSKPHLFFNILAKSIKYYFEKQSLFVSLLLIGTIVIIIYRKIKKQKDQLCTYLPLILIFTYVFLYSCFFSSSIAFERYYMPIVPLVIFSITIWCYKITEQFFGKYSLIGFICLFLILFLLNPKEMPGKRKYKSCYRSVYDILKENVNPENKLLIAPVTIYFLDRGYQHDLYFGKNAVYMCHLPLKNEYNPESLKKLLDGINIRYIFVGNTIDRRLIDPNCPIVDKFGKTLQPWLRNDKSPYSLEKDLEIIQAYIHSKGGLLINENRFGKIYYLTGDKSVRKKFGLITNGSFEHWWKDIPMGEWKLINGRIFKSQEATDGINSLRFEPGQKEGSRIIRIFEEPRHLLENGSKLRVRLDAKAGKSDRLIFFFTAKINGKWQKVESAAVRYPGKGEWVTLSGDLVITPGMKRLIFHLRLSAGAREPAFVDNLSIELLNEERERL